LPFPHAHTTRIPPPKAAKMAGKMPVPKKRITPKNTHLFWQKIAGQRIQTITPAGRTVGYIYNTLGQVASITTNGSPLITQIHHHAFGGLKRF